MGSSGIGDAYRCKNVGPGLEAGAAKTAGNPTTLQGENTPGK